MHCSCKGDRRVACRATKCRKHPTREVVGKYREGLARAGDSLVVHCQAFCQSWVMYVSISIIHVLSACMYGILVHTSGTYHMYVVYTLFYVYIRIAGSVPRNEDISADN